MSHHNSIQGNQPKKIIFNHNENQEELDLLPGNIQGEEPTDHLIISGQGTLVFMVDKNKIYDNNINLTFSGIEIIEEKAEKEGEPNKLIEKEKFLQLIIHEKGAEFKYRDAPDGNWQSFELIEPTEKSPRKIDTKTGIITPPDGYGLGIDLDESCRYWVSIDSLNKRLRYGKGEMRVATTLLEYQYDTPRNLFNKNENKEYRFINFLKNFDASQGVKLLTLWKDPIVSEPPTKVLPTNQFTMDDAATNSAATPTSLSKECQILYGNVAGFQLNTPDFPDFEQAIEYSMRTEGCIGYNILKEKIDNSPFGDDDDDPSESKDKPKYREAYLRITLGQSQGESPGIPYVMEIWPVGCASPIHHHGYTHAIIKVLRGKIDVDVYRMLPSKHSSDDALATVTFEPNDVTYLMPEVNQFHKLKNNLNNVDTCITIQSYSYSQDDDDHYATFDYVEKKKVDHFDPISDKDFLSFKKEVKDEWEAYLKKRFWEIKKSED